MTTSPRRGRLPADQREARRQSLLAAALAELVERGASGLTMTGVARRADASKETLYAWFGSRDDLIAELIRTNADASAQRIAEAIGAGEATLEAARATLTAYADGLLTLLTSPSSIELNRAAMGNPRLAEQLLESGRHRIGPLVETYLADLARAGVLDISDPPRAYRVLYGLVVRDTQIRVLLGEPSPDDARLSSDVESAIEAFMTLYSPTADSPGK